MQILIVEPSADLGKVLSRSLEDSGHTVSIAHTAQQGIEKADKASPDMIILELLMARHNGLEFVHELRSYAEWQKVPIILYSHISKEELGLDDELLAQLGIVKHLYKPAASLSGLVKAVESNLAPNSI